MKLLTTLFIVIGVNALFSQTEKRLGPIHVKATTYYYKLDSLDESGKKRKEFKDAFYFDTHGKLLERIKRALTNNKDVQTFDALYQYLYDGQKLVREDQWTRYVNKKRAFYEFTEYDYDEKDSLISESYYSTNRDSLYFSRKYTYSKNQREMIDNLPGHKQIWFYNDEGKILKIEDYSKSWEGNTTYSYLYSENGMQRIHSGQDPKISITYNTEKKILTREVAFEDYAITYHYNYRRNGLIKEISWSWFSHTDNEHEKMSSIHFTYISTRKLSVQSVALINQSLSEVFYQ